MMSNKKNEQDESEGLTKMSLRQKEIMVEFMEDHPDFAKQKLLGNDGKQTRKAMWDILTTQLNCVNGPKKTSQKWQRAWIDLKNKVKKKASAIKNSMSQTGGGPQLKVLLNDVESKILNIIGDAAVYGLQSTQAAPLDSEDVNQPDQPALNIRIVDVPEQKSASNQLSQDGLPSSDIMSPIEGDSVASEDHNYFSMSVGKAKKRKLPQRRPSSSSATETSEPRVLSGMSSSDEFTPRRQRVRPLTSVASVAAERFAEIGETLNKRMESIDSKLDVLIKERQETNSILKNVVAAIESLKK